MTIHPASPARPWTDVEDLEREREDIKWTKMLVTNVIDTTKWQARGSTGLIEHIEQIMDDRTRLEGEVLSLKQRVSFLEGQRDMAATVLAIFFGKAPSDE